MKKFLVLALTAVMILSVASVMIIPGAAAVEGDWVATRAADDYLDPDSYRPYCGFHYEVDKGLVLDSADYTNCIVQYDSIQVVQDDCIQFL